MPALPAGTYPSSYGDAQPTMTAFVSAVVENLSNDTSSNLVQTGQVTGLLLKGASQIPLVGSQNGVFPFSNNKDTAINVAQTGQVTSQLIMAMSKIPLNASVSGGFVTVPVAPLATGASTELIIS